MINQKSLCILREHKRCLCGYMEHVLRTSVRMRKDVLTPRMGVAV